MSGDYLSNRMIDAEIKKCRKEDLRFFMNANEFDKALEELDDEMSR